MTEEKKAHQVSDEWRECVVVCECGWRTAARTKTAARREWLAHVGAQQERVKE